MDLRLAVTFGGNGHKVNVRKRHTPFQRILCASMAYGRMPPFAGMCWLMLRADVERHLWPPKPRVVGSIPASRTRPRVTRRPSPPKVKHPLSLAHVLHMRGCQANVFSISRRSLTAVEWASNATSFQLTACPAFTGLSSFTPWARPNGKPPRASDSRAGSSLPNTV